VAPPLNIHIRAWLPSQSVLFLSRGYTKLEVCTSSAALLFTSTNDY